MMVPTVGRVVYYNQGTLADPKLFAAIIAFVPLGVNVGDRLMVNLMVIDPEGHPFSATNVLQGSEDGQWDWMPYQKQKAAVGDHNSESAEPRP